MRTALNCLEGHRAEGSHLFDNLVCSLVLWDALEQDGTLFSQATREVEEVALCQRTNQQAIASSEVFVAKTH